MNTSPNLNLNLPELTDTADITPITANFSIIDTFAGNVYDKTEVYTKTEADTLLSAKANDNAVVHKAYDEDITGVKTYTYSAIGTNPARADLGRIRIKASNVDITNNSHGVEAPSIQWWDNASHLCGVINAEYEADGSSQIILGPRRANGNLSWFIMNPDYMSVPSPGSDAPTSAVPTINWVSQTGSGALNNLLHNTGDESFIGTKSSENLQHINTRPYLFQRVTASNNWFKVFTMTTAPTARRIIVLDVIWAHQSYNGYGIGRAVLATIGGNTTAQWLYRKGNASDFKANTIFIGAGENGTDIWIKGGYYVYVEIARAIRGNVEQTIEAITNVYDGVGVSEIDTTQYEMYAYGVE